MNLVNFSRVENGLGTMGSELLGLGPRNVAVKDTFAWRRMSTAEKFDFWKERMERVAPGSDAMELAAGFARAIKHGTFQPVSESHELQQPMQLRGRLEGASCATFFR